MFSGDSQRANFKCWVHENVRHGPSLSLKRCKSSSASFSCCFPWERHKSSPPSSEDTVPGESPNIQGIKRHLAFLYSWRSVLSFIYPILISSCPPCFWELQMFNLITLISPKVLSFILSPTCSPLGASHWSVFNLFLCFIGQWCIAEYNAAARDWFLQPIKISRTDILSRLILGRHRSLTSHPAPQFKNMNTSLIRHSNSS